MEKFFERNPLQVFTVINMVVLGLSVIVLALMNFLGVYDVNEIVIKAQLESFLGVIAILFIVFFLGNKADVSKLFLMKLLFIFIIYLSLGYHLPI